MMNNHTGRTYRSAQTARVKPAVTPEPIEVPMRRYPHPIGAAAPSGSRAVSPSSLTPLLEEAQRQKQRLVDLLGAVNALTAAVLCQRGKN